MNRDISITFRVNEKEENLILEKYRGSNEKNLSSFIRKFLISKNLLTLDTKDISKSNYEISKIGTNINQIAKRVNTFNLISKSDLDYLFDKISIIEKQQKQILRKIKQLKEGEI